LGNFPKGKGRASDKAAKPTASGIIDNFIKKGQMSEIDKTFKNQVFNIWNYQKADNQIKYPGNVPQDIVAVEGKRRGEKKSSLVENLPQQKTRDIVASKVGWSGIRG